MTVHRFNATVWHNSHGSAPPSFFCAAGDTIITHTLDAAGCDKDGVMRASPPNPTNGAIFVHGAEPGDALCVEILRMTPTRDTGWTNAIVAANVVDPEMAPALPPKERVTWLINRQDGTVRLANSPQGLEGLILPLQPMIGCFWGGSGPRSSALQRHQR
jgi:acetamidase/formamidase